MMSTNQPKPMSRTMALAGRAKRRAVTAIKAPRMLFNAPCIICGARRVTTHHVTRPKRDYDIRLCHACKFVSNPSNTVDYSKFTSVTQFSSSPRVGTETHRGREFHMAKMAVDILGRENVSVMVFGAGRSLDYRHIAEIPQVGRVVMADVVDLGVDEGFLNINDGTDERFDIIIACEVVEHFIDPATEFPRLFELIASDGLVVCSTNIYDGGGFVRHTYLYSRGHTSYYSEAAIQLIASQAKLHVDFRTPRISKQAGPRKRYLLFTPSTVVPGQIDTYFEDREFAPSEKPNWKKIRQKRRRLEAEANDQATVKQA